MCRRRDGGGLVVFGLVQGDLVGLVPLSLEPFYLGVSFINSSGYRIYGIDTVDKCQVESFSKEEDEDSLIDYSTKVGSNFELIDIGEDFIFGLSDGLKMDKGFCLEISCEECFSEEGLVL